MRTEAQLFDREAAEETTATDNVPLGILMDEPELTIGLRIQEARRKAGMTQGELADRTALIDSAHVGIKRGALSLYEIGRSNPGPREIRLLCEALKVSPNMLIYGNEDPFDELTEAHRYRFGTSSSAGLYARMVYRVSRLHHHHRLAILKLLEGLLFAASSKFDVEENRHAEEEFLRLAEELKARRSL